MKEKTIKCPKCKVDMKKLTKGKHIIDACPKCRGIFLDEDEIKRTKNIGFLQYIMDYFR